MGGGGTSPEILNRIKTLENEIELLKDRNEFIISEQSADQKTVSANTTFSLVIEATHIDGYKPVAITEITLFNLNCCISEFSITSSGKIMVGGKNTNTKSSTIMPYVKIMYQKI